jgi:hypothetical protein
MTLFDWCKTIKRYMLLFLGQNKPLIYLAVNEWFDIPEGDLKIPTLNITKLVRFHQLRIWSESEVESLLNWHLANESHFRRGWNNNLSLISTNVSPGEVTHSLICYKLEHFKLSFLLIMPFQVEEDSRNILRAFTTFTDIKRHCKVFSQQSEAFLEGEDRQILIDGLCKRIQIGFGWSNMQKRNLIYRYRLVAILNDPKLVIDKDIHVHHLDGINKILSGNNDCLNDTIRNLQVLTMSQHNELHNSSGDDGFISYADL